MEQIQPVEFVYLGAIGDDGGAALLLLTGNEDIDKQNMYDVSHGVYTAAEVKTYSKKAGRYFSSPGCVYAVHVSSESKHVGDAIFSNTARYLRPWPDNEVKVRIQGIALTAQRTREGKIKREKLEKESTLLSTLDEARQAYKSAVGLNRAQLLAAFVEYITK